jgi:4-coumarate--CoA ligase
MHLRRSLVRCARLSIRYSSDNIVRSKFSSDILTSQDYEKSVPRVVMKDFMSTGIKDKVALMDGFTGETATYAQLYQRTYSCAQNLQKRFGVSKGSCVGILSPNHINFFTAFHGVALTGGHSTTLNPLYVEDEIEFQLKTTEAKLLIAHPLCLPKGMTVARKLNIPIFTLGADKVDGAESFNDLLQIPLSQIDQSVGADPDVNSLMTVPFSSGTTGLPKVQP